MELAWFEICLFLPLPSWPWLLSGLVTLTQTCEHSQVQTLSYLAGWLTSHWHVPTWQRSDTDDAQLGKGRL